MLTPPSPLPSSAWLARARSHKARIAPITSAYRDRKARGQLHPVHDFLFTYYPFPPGKLEQWHPALGESLLLDEAPLPHFSQKYYKTRNNTTLLDPSILRPKDHERLRFSLNLLKLTAARPANLSCLGLHEWAMVYKSDNPRHRERAPLRLPSNKIANFLESQTLACTHFDATRFFTPAAQPLNQCHPTLLTRQDHEQPGCIHANMDLYKWAFKAMPWIGSDFLRETFLLAMELRELDMQASPYDLSAYGYEPVKIETPAGKAEYIRRQQALSQKAVPLRSRLISTLDQLLSGCPHPLPASPTTR